MAHFGEPTDRRETERCIDDSSVQEDLPKPRHKLVKDVEEPGGDGAPLELEQGVQQPHPEEQLRKVQKRQRKP